MIPTPRRLLLAAAFATLVAVAVGACGAAPEAPPSFAATGPCDGSGRAAGTYPDLEARLPDRYEEAAPTAVDSGRTCTRDALGTLADAGVEDVRFAGATWDLGNGRAIAVALFEGDGVTPSTMIDFYEAGARDARRTETLATSDVMVDGRAGRRLDVLYGQTGQTIVAWPTREADATWVLLAADIGDAAVEDALEVYGAR